MKTRFIVIYVIFFIVLGGSMTYKVYHCFSAEALPKHTVEINRLMIALAHDWEDISDKNGELTESAQSFDYAVLDETGEVLVYTKKGMATTVSAATGHYDIIRNIEKDGAIIGYLIVYDPYMEIQLSSRRRTVIMMSGTVWLMLMISVGYFIFLKKRIVEPFGKMKGFAEKIAAGDLDTPLDMDRGNIFGAFTESFDIMREELKAARLREEAAVKSRKEMIAELSHDIKTPVASIKAMADFMELTLDNEEQKKTVSAINSKADQIDALVSNLFHATLEELEQLEVSPEETGTDELRKIIAESDHLSKVTSSDIKDCVILADRLRLEQVVGNIISNSYKYADTEITVESRFEGKNLIVSFSDKGGGVPEEELEVITEKFRRGTNSQGKSGSGIGLYISKYLMERMEGELTCRNNGEGFTVELRFKLV